MLTSSELTIYKSDLTVYASASNSWGARRVLMRADGSAPAGHRRERQSLPAGVSTVDVQRRGHRQLRAIRRIPLTILQLFPDLICVAIVLLFLIFGYHRGMFRTLSGLMTWLVSLFGAKLIADWGAPRLADLLLPRVQPYVTQRLAQAIAEGASSASGGEGLGDLGMLGLVPGVQDLLEGVTETLAETIAPGRRAAGGPGHRMAHSLCAGIFGAQAAVPPGGAAAGSGGSDPGAASAQPFGGSPAGGLEGLLLLALAVAPAGAV